MWDFRCIGPSSFDCVYNFSQASSQHKYTVTSHQAYDNIHTVLRCPAWLGPSPLWPIQYMFSNPWGCPRRRPWTKLRTHVCSYPIIVTHLSFNFLCLLLLYSIYLNGWRSACPNSAGEGYRRGGVPPPPPPPSCSGYSWGRGTPPPAHYPQAISYAKRAGMRAAGPLFQMRGPKGANHQSPPPNAEKPGSWETLWGYLHAEVFLWPKVWICVVGILGLKF